MERTGIEILCETIGCTKRAVKVIVLSKRGKHHNLRWVCTESASTFEELGYLVQDPSELGL